jgi:hypothetical protein
LLVLPFVSCVSIQAKNVGGDGSNPVGDAGGPSSPHVEDCSMPHDGDAASDASRDQSEGVARGVAENPANVAIDDRSREV